MSQDSMAYSLFAYARSSCLTELVSINLMVWDSPAAAPALKGASLQAFRGPQRDRRSRQPAPALPPARPVWPGQAFGPGVEVRVRPRPLEAQPPATSPLAPPHAPMS